MNEIIKEQLFSGYTLLMGLMVVALIMIGWLVPVAAFINLLMWVLSFVSIGFVALVLYLSSTKQTKN